MGGWMEGWVGGWVMMDGLCSQKPHQQVVMLVNSGSGLKIGL